MKIRKILCVMALFVLVSAAVPSLTLYAADEILRKADVQVELFEDGSAYITETLEIDNLYGVTEYFIYVPKRENLSVSSLEVADESGQLFEQQSSWDVDQSLEEKSYKCGILETDNRYELCWGIGSYGDHTYTVRYKIAGFVQAYEDRAGFYYQFYNSEQAAGMETFDITIFMAATVFSLDNARIWGIGFDSYIDFADDGSIYAYNEASIRDDQTVRVMCGFNSELFPTAPAASGTFEAVQERGLNGEDPEEDEFNMGILAAIIGAIAGTAVVAVILIAAVDSKIRLADGMKQKRPKWKQAEPRSTLPFEGNIPAACYCLKEIRQVRQEGTTFGAYLIKWENDGYLHMENQNEKSKKKMKAVIIFNHEQPSFPEYEMKMYRMIKKLADEDGQLTQKAFQRWVDKHYDKIVKWEKELEAGGKSWLNINGYLKQDEKGKFRFTQRGYEQLWAFQGLHRYLKEYDQHYSAGEVHTELWGDYLIYAILFGINEQLIVGLSESDPVYFNQFSHHYGYDNRDMIHLFIIANMMSHSTVSHAQGVSTAGGGGGSASIGGGGGFSGGGGGAR